ncbi:MAG: ribonuclease HII [Bdellovibrionales bacterium]|nr:ribonuclease HII [Bdellovibrionales bacterium]
MKIAGIDEAGRGPLAGPVVAAAVVLPEGYQNPLITDSKKLSAKKRELLAVEIKQVACSYSIVAVGHRRIDRLNILQATRTAMKLAAARVDADFIRIDGNVGIDCAVPFETVVQGDSKHIEISAASILAKVYRDELMTTLDRKYPGYGFSGHAGYPTKSHKEAIATQGPCPVHRLSFRGVKEFCEQARHMQNTTIQGSFSAGN